MWLVMWLWICKRTYTEESTNRYDFTFIYKHLPFLPREERTFCVKKDEVALNFYVKNKNYFVKIKFKSFLKSYPRNENEAK